MWGAAAPLDDGALSPERWSPPPPPPPSLDLTQPRRPMAIALPYLRYEKKKKKNITVARWRTR